MKHLHETDVMAHYESPYHRGRIVEPTCAHLEPNPVCGDWVRLELRLDGAGRIESAYFEGGGCVIRQAAAVEAALGPEFRHDVVPRAQALTLR
jgi:nitrogen fixation protein NifU and related proteins